MTFQYRTIYMRDSKLIPCVAMIMFRHIMCTRFKCTVHTHTHILLSLSLMPPFIKQRISSHFYKQIHLVHIRCIFSGLQWIVVCHCCTRCSKTLLPFFWLFLSTTTTLSQEKTGKGEDGNVCREKILLRSWNKTCNSTAAPVTKACVCVCVYSSRKMSFKNLRQLKKTRTKQDLSNEKLNRNYKYCIYSGRRCTTVAANENYMGREKNRWDSTSGNRLRACWRWCMIAQRQANYDWGRQAVSQPVNFKAMEKWRKKTWTGESKKSRELFKSLALGLSSMDERYDGSENNGAESKYNRLAFNAWIHFEEHSRFNPEKYTKCNVEKEHI